ncbi:hypothetical protein HDU96_009667 [Phlyctochytrium bullatum]|nr:hypothetical protein HDU96_009667 [Phlyctochytrium bullatum]
MLSASPAFSAVSTGTSFSEQAQPGSLAGARSVPRRRQSGGGVGGVAGSVAVSARKAVSRSYYSSESGGSSLQLFPQPSQGQLDDTLATTTSPSAGASSGVGVVGSLCTLSSSAIRQQTIEFSYREMHLSRSDLPLHNNYKQSIPYHPHQSPQPLPSSSVPRGSVTILNDGDGIGGAGVASIARSRSASNLRQSTHASTLAVPIPQTHSTLDVGGDAARSFSSSSHSSPSKAGRASQLSALRQLAMSFEAERLADRVEQDRASKSAMETSGPRLSTSPPAAQFPNHGPRRGSALSIEHGVDYDMSSSPSVGVQILDHRKPYPQYHHHRHHHAYSQHDHDAEPPRRPHHERPDESTPLLGTASTTRRDGRGWRAYLQKFTPWKAKAPRSPERSEQGGWCRSAKNVFAEVWWLALQALPAVVLGLILNLLDALSYGIIIFPSNSRGSIPMHSATQSGISMFLASTIVSQLVFAFGGSAFKGANGSMMIEVMPFLHVMVKQIEAQLIPAGGEGMDTRPVLATIMVAYALSTVLTGIAFLLLGVFRLGNLIQFFPRHILVGCIGGIGWFLFVTGIEVTTGGLKPELSLEFLQALVEPSHLILWGSALGLAMFLKLMQTRIHHPLFVPLFYVAVPVLFYVIALGFLRMSIEDLRDRGFLFRMPPGDPVPFYTFWTYFNGFQGVRWDALPATLGTQAALVFFAVLHVPINVPALSVSTHQNVDVNWEIVGHGLANLAAGVIGTPQNYLVYSNSLLYIRSGGNSTIGGILLAVATAAIWIYGGSVIGFVPTLVVGSLIFHLAFDLVKESLWDSRRVGISHLEYATILGIVVTMAVFGFTEGILTGMVLACFFFVIMYSRKSIIRSTHTGAEVRSTVHRPYRQKLFLDEVGEQIRVVKLQGFMFFGVISQLESYLETLIEEVPRIRFVVLEFSLITGVDYSAMEAFLRIKRLLLERRVHLIFCELGVISRDLALSGIFDHDGDEESQEIRPHDPHHHSTARIADDYFEVVASREALEEEAGATTPANIPSSVAHTAIVEVVPADGDEADEYATTSAAVTPVQALGTEQDRRDAALEKTAVTARVHNFETLDQALEFCENCLLVTFYRVRAAVEARRLRVLVGGEESDGGQGHESDKEGDYERTALEEQGEGETPQTRAGILGKRASEEELVERNLNFGETKTSPRIGQARSSAYHILKDDPNLDLKGLGFATASPPKGAEGMQGFGGEPEHLVDRTHPVPALLRSFADATSYMSPRELELLASKFERLELRPGAVLWTPGSPADSVYLVESGELAQLFPNQGRMEVVETLLPGTMVGELEMVSGRNRSCRLVVEEPAIVWRLTAEAFDALCGEHPRLSLAFLRMALGFDCMRFSTCLSHQR